MKKRLSEARKPLVPWMVCAITYCGLLIIEGLFFGGDMKVSLYTLYAALGALAGILLIHFFFPKVKYIPFFVCVITQLVFIGMGFYLQEMEFYFIIMLVLVTVVSVSKIFKMMTMYLLFSVFINILIMIFLVPYFDWLNHFRFFMQFALFLCGSTFMLIQTFYIAQRETRAERALSSFSSLLKSTPNYMVITDPDSRVRYISQPMVEFAHHSRMEFALGQPLIDLFTDKALKFMFADILRADGFVETTMTIETDGEERHFKVIADKMADDVGGLFIDISDITPIINSMKKAEEAQRRAEAANASKTQFLATMSHEIRTPLNAVNGISQMQLQKEGVPDEYAEAFEKIYHSGNGLLKIINDILDMSKIETGKLEFHLAEYDVPSLINDTVQLNLVRIGSKAIQFILDIDESLPSRLYGDELRLKQILNNLLSNAIKYTQHGYVKLLVRHRFENEDVILHFAVEDTGQGLKNEDQVKIFSEYTRVNAEANRETEGTGLGLNITKRLVEMMGGTIEVISEYGKGSVFTVKVNQKAVDALPIGPLIVKQLNNFTFTSDRKLTELQITINPMPYGKVLVVDDVDTNLYVAEGLLAPYKLKVEAANNGFAVIDMVKGGAVYDVIFMDHMMPLMDGIETTQELRRMGYVGVIIALTANALVGNDKMFQENGFDGFIAKPIDIRRLNKVLNKYIRDRYPEEAKNNELETALQTKPALTDQSLIGVFCRDAGNAVIKLQEIVESGNIKLFTTTVHAMKSALMNIGETEASEAAFALEKAGLAGNTRFISDHTVSFIDMLTEIVESFRQAESADEDNTDILEDTVFLSEQLAVLKTACEDYDSKAAYAVLNLLIEKQWGTATTSALSKIQDMLFHSEFENAKENTEKLLKAL